jgi:hypothetical protein
MLINVASIFKNIWYREAGVKILKTSCRKVFSAIDKGTFECTQKGYSEKRGGQRIKKRRSKTAE